MSDLSELIGFELSNLRVDEISLVAKAANKRQFLVQKTDEPESIVQDPSYLRVAALADRLIQKSAEPLSKAAAIARVVERDPALYGTTIEKSDDDRAIATAAIFKSAFDHSGEKDFAAFVSRRFAERPELAAAWYASSLSNT
jgi:hypothetical protein